MVIRRPLVLISGKETELPPGDTLLGVSVGELVASSGLAGGGDLSTTVNIQAKVAPNASGVILVGDKLSLDGVALRDGQSALASGNHALVLSEQALLSGVAAYNVALTAQSSGDAALLDIAAVPNGVIRTYSTAGSVASGYPVGLRLDGTVETIGVIEDLDARSYGSGVALPTLTAGDYYSSVNLSGTNNVFIAHRSTSNYGYGTVATIDNLKVTYGTPVNFTTTNQFHIDVAVNPASGQCLIVSNNASYVAYGRLANITGTSISYGTDASYNGTAVFNQTTYVPSVDKYLITYSNSSNYYGYGVVATASGSSLNYGTPTVFRSAAVSYPAITYDPSSDRAILVFTDGGAGNFGTALVASISGTTPIYHSQTVFNSTVGYYYAITTDESEGTQYIASRDITNNKNLVHKGSVIANTFVAGVGEEFDPDASANPIAISYDKRAERAVISYGASNLSSSRSIAVSSSGNTLTAGTPTTFSTSNSTYLASSYNDNQERVLITYRSTSLISTASTVNFNYTPTVSGLTPYLGVAQHDAPSGSSVSVRLPGSVDPNFSGLSPGNYYYLDPQASGVTISGAQPPSFSGVAAWAPIGQALASDKLLLTQFQ